MKKLFECNTDPDEQNIYNIVEEKPIADETENFILSTDITEDEILRAVRALKVDKSAGPDVIVPGLFLYSFYRSNFANIT